MNDVLLVSELKNMELGQDCGQKEKFWNFLETKFVSLFSRHMTLIHKTTGDHIVKVSPPGC